MSSLLDRKLGRREEQHLSDLQLDRHLSAEIDESAHLGECEVCSARLEQLRDDRARFEKEVWISGEAAKLRKRDSGSGRVIAGMITALAAMLAFVIWLPQPDVTRTKGSDYLELVARRADGNIEQVLPGQALAPGDAVRFVVSIKHAGYVTVVGLDEAGRVTEYVPSTYLPAGNDQALEGSIILDETPGFERVVAFVCATPVSPDQLMMASQAALDRVNGQPRLVRQIQPDCGEASFLFEKS